MIRLRKPLFIVLIAAILAAPVSATGSGKVTGSYVNIRSGPGTNYSVIGGCVSGTTVSLIGENGNWYNISVNGVVGYMSKAYVSAFTTVSQGVVTGTVVNIRNGAGTQHACIGTAVKGDRLQILETLDGWYKIDNNGQTGYISSTYVQLEQNSSSGTIGRVTGSVVNLRKGPGTTYGVVGRVLRDDVLTVLGESGGWYKVSYQDTEAYISGTYLSVEGDVDTETPPEIGTTVTGKGIVTGSVVNLRSGAGTNFPIVGQVLKDRQFDVYGEINGWCVVDFNGNQAYISATYLKVTPVETTKDATVTGTVVNLRSGAGTTYQIIGQVKKGDVVKVSEQSGDWYKVTTADSLTGYISASYLSFSEPGQGDPPGYTVTPMDKTGLVVGSFTNVRKQPTVESPAVAILSKGTYVTITGFVQDGWYQVKYKNITGFMSSDYVVAEDNSNGGSSGGGGSPQTEKPLGEQICDYAMQFIGIPYVYGGSSPNTGFDCSGLTQYVYKHFGYNVNRVRQYTEGTKVAKEDLKPGDLVFFNTQGAGISHVGLYIGNGQFLHAPSPGKTVCIARLDSDYYVARYVCAVRIVT